MPFMCAGLWSVVGSDENKLAIVLAHQMARGLACHHLEFISAFMLSLLPGCWLNKRLKPFHHLRRLNQRLSRHDAAIRTCVLTMANACSVCSKPILVMVTWSGTT